MAIPGTFYTQIEYTLGDVAKHPITNSAVAGTLKGIIQRGVLPKKIGGSSAVTTNWYARATASDISGYNTLSTTNSNDNTVYTCNFMGGSLCPCAAVSFATDAGAMDGVNSVNETTTHRVRAKYALGTQHCLGSDGLIIVDVYHRDTSGTETLIGSGRAIITTSYSTVTINMTINSSWATNERLVVKYRFTFSGGGLLV
jgi:hypothetical protein